MVRVGLVWFSGSQYGASVFGNYLGDRELYLLSRGVEYIGYQFMDSRNLSMNFSGLFVRAILKILFSPLPFETVNFPATCCILGLAGGAVKSRATPRAKRERLDTATRSLILSWRRE